MVDIQSLNKMIIFEIYLISLQNEIINNLQKIQLIVNFRYNVIFLLVKNIIISIYLSSLLLFIKAKYKKVNLIACTNNSIDCLEKNT